MVWGSRGGQKMPPSKAGIPSVWPQNRPTVTQEMETTLFVPRKVRQKHSCREMIYILGSLFCEKHVFRGCPLKTQPERVLITPRNIWLILLDPACVTSVSEVVLWQLKQTLVLVLKNNPTETKLFQAAFLCFLSSAKVSRNSSKENKVSV